jgi:hypothetical protein
MYFSLGDHGAMVSTPISQPKGPQIDPDHRQVRNIFICTNMFSFPSLQISKVKTKAITRSSQGSKAGL